MFVPWQEVQPGSPEARMRNKEEADACFPCGGLLAVPTQGGAEADVDEDLEIHRSELA